MIVEQRGPRDRSRSGTAIESTEHVEELYTRLTYRVFKRKTKLLETVIWVWFA